MKSESPKAGRKAQIDELLLKLPGVSARKINGLDAYFVADKMFACISGKGIGLRLPVASATELQFSRGDVVGLISRAGGKGSGRFGQCAGDPGMTAIKVQGRCHGLLRCAEHHRKHHIESAVKPADRVGQYPRVPGDRGSDPRMGELEQQRAAGAEKDRRLSVDLPHQRARAEYARAALRRGLADDRELMVEIGFAHGPR